MSKNALFLDRDGVINIDHGYVHKKENFDFIDGIFDLVGNANKKGYLIVVVTNQAGIGRGLYTEEIFHSLTNWMIKKFFDNGSRIDSVYFSPYHPEFGIGKYRKVSNCRKPAPGMILQAKKDLNIDLEKSLLIGDSLKDMEAAKAAGVGKSLFFRKDNNKIQSDKSFIQINNLRDALRYL